MLNIRRGNRRLLPLVLGLLLSVSVACGLTQGLAPSSEEPTPPLESEASNPSTDAERPSVIDESAPGDSDTSTPSQQEGSAAEADDPPPSEKSERPGQLAEQQIFVLPGAEPPTMDPHLSGDATSAEYVVEIYSGLMAYDNELNLIPDIAESYEVSEGGLVYTFKIRDDAVFQDGKPIAAEDFKWSFERACDPATGSPTADTYLGDVVGCREKLQGEADDVEGVTVVDDKTLQLTIDEPIGFFLAKLTYPTAYVLDREDVEGDPNWATDQPNGSGPFALAEYAPEEGAIVLTKNENYYRDPQPTLERVVYLINAPINLLSGYEQGLGQLGLSSDFTYNAIPVGISDLSRLTDPSEPLSDEFVSTPELNVSYIGFNVNEPPFDDPNIRQAFNLGLDKRRMVRLVFQDTYPVANGIVPPTMPGYQNPDLSDYEFDPERALELIGESSYGDPSELPEITLNVSGTGGQVGSIIEAIVESYKENLGVEINVEQTPWAEFLEDLNQPDPPYQMYQLGWIADYPDPQNFLEVLFHSESSQNHGNYSNPEVDRLLEQARTAQDSEERLQLYQQAEQMILDDAAWVPLYFGVENWLVKPYVHGFKIPPMKIPKFQYVSIAEH